MRLKVSLFCTVMKNLDCPTFDPPGPNILKYLDLPEQICWKYMDPFWNILSRLTVVSHKAKKEQSESPKTKRATKYCVFYASERFRNVTS